MHGSPLKPLMEMHLKTAGGVISTRGIQHLTIGPIWIRWCRRWRQAAGGELDKSLLHVIDREADSVDYFRKWDAAGFKFLVRADDRRVQWSGKSVLLSEILMIATDAG